MSMKKSDTIGNRTRDLPVCSAVRHRGKCLTTKLQKTYFYLTEKIVVPHYKYQSINAV
jgi:hypothetical protein